MSKFGELASKSRLLRAERLLMDLGNVLGIRLRLHSDVTGDRWIAECISQFSKQHGPENVRDVSKRQLPYDLVVKGMRVQCKSRSPKRGRSMSIEKSWGSSRYGEKTFDFLALKYGEDRYVIPMQALTSSRGCFKNDIQPDKFWRYRDKWALQAPGLEEPFDQDFPLFRTAE